MWKYYDLKNILGNGKERFTVAVGTAVDADCGGVTELKRSGLATFK